MKMEALTSTNVIKTLVTCEGSMDIERKNKQSYQGVMYVRLICMGNGTLKALHDKTDGFYRRQIILCTKPKPKDRIDDPYLKEKLEAEIQGILNWCIEGLKKLIADNFRFTISERSQKVKKDLVSGDNNMIGFFESEGYIEFAPDAQTTSMTLYDVYKRWCYDNAERAVAESTFTKHLSSHADELRIRTNKYIRVAIGKYARGYDGIRTVIDGFHRIEEGDPDCPFN